MLPDRVSRLLTAYVDGELDTQQRERVVRWLRRSPEARELLQGLQRDAEQLGSLARHSLGQDFAQQVLQIIADRQAESTRRSALTIPSSIAGWTGLATAAAALLALGLGTYYFIADRPRPSEPLAVHIPGHDHASVGEPVESPVPDLPVAKPAPRERLGPPVPEIPPSTAVAPTPNPRPQAGRREMPLASPVGKVIPPFKDFNQAIALPFDLRELVHEKPRQQLNQALQKTDSHWIELRCSDTLAGIEQLRSAFGEQGVRCILDQDARAILKLGMGPDPVFALYCEEITVHEVVTVLEQLGEKYRKGFQDLVLKPMPWEDGRKLAHYLGIDSDQLKTPAPLAPELGKAEGKTEDRQALVVAYTPGRPRPTSPELKRFLAGRKQLRPDTTRVFIILSSSKR